MARMTITGDMRQRIMDHAQELVQTSGYDGFSFADVAGLVGIRKASIHHHFPTKADLGLSLIERFRAICRASLVEFDALPEPAARLDGFIGMFRQTLESGRMCLCGILAAGFGNLPGPIRVEVAAAFEEQVSWAARVLAEGRDRGDLAFDGPALDQARLLVSGLEGGMLLARVHDDNAHFEAVARSFLGRLMAEGR